MFIILKFAIYHYNHQAKLTAIRKQVKRMNMLLGSINFRTNPGPILGLFSVRISDVSPHCFQGKNAFYAIAVTLTLFEKNNFNKCFFMYRALPLRFRIAGKVKIYFRQKSLNLILIPLPAINILIIKRKKDWLFWGVSQTFLVPTFN